ASLRNPQPLDPARLYLSVYPPPEAAYRLANHPQPVGEVTRPGSTPMWAGLRFVNGYSPIRTAGVGRAWAFYTHGEIDRGMADYLLGYEAGPNGLLARIGVDGIIVAQEIATTPAPATEWTLVRDDEEGRVYERVGAPFARVRSLGFLEELPNEKLARAKVHLREDSRQKVVADVEVPPGDSPATLVFARPFFDGYRATLNGRHLPVDSFRGLAPVVQLPPGAHGRLTLIYRPWWLLLGGAIAMISALVMIVAAGLAFWPGEPESSKTPRAEQ
ncbi:MAG: hypothetical protein ACREP1_12225, partial [Rhodanobacteraceae bacterium]